MMLGAGLPRSEVAWQGEVIRRETFDFPEVGPLSRDYARLALAKPARDEGVEIEPDALDAVVDRTEGYPYCLHELGKHLWNVAEQSPIALTSVEIASRQAIADLDGSFFLVRFDRLTPTEQEYLRAMSQRGPGAHRSGDVASQFAPSGDFPGSHPQPVDQQGHDLEPESRRHGVHRADVRRVHAPDHDGRSVAVVPKPPVKAISKF